jgi:hypothetical protein
LIWLYSLPSEKRAGAALAKLHIALGVAAPFLRHRPQVSLVRSRTGLPRSSTMGRKPICASTSAAKMPQGPKPTTTGRSLAGRAGANRRVGSMSGVGPMCGCLPALPAGGLVRGIGQRHIDDVHHHQLGLAGVEAALEDVGEDQSNRDESVQPSG